MKEWSNNITSIHARGSIHPDAIVHPTAIVEAGAVIEEGVKVGPYCVIGGNVVLKSNVELKSHVIVTGPTVIGEGTVAYPFAVIGEISQDMKYYHSKEFTGLTIGKNNIIREHVTIHLGTPASSSTVIGDNNLFMVGVHVAHDCIIGNNIYIANGTALAGHVEIADYAIIGGQCGVLQFCKIGRNAMVGGRSSVKQDVLPYSLVDGEECYWKGLNWLGLKRKGFSLDQIKNMEKVYEALFADNGKTVIEKVASIKENFELNEEVKEILGAVENESRHSFIQPKK